MINNCENDLTNVKAIYDKNYDDLLDGDLTVEPEGYVVYTNYKSV